MSTAPAPTSLSTVPGGMAELTLDVQDLYCGYGPTEVLRSVSIAVPAGEVVALLGPNGAGKTTLLRAIAGSMRPIRGTIRLDGHDVTADPPHVRARQGLVHIPEGRGIFRSLTVEENLILQAPGRTVDAVERATEAFPVLGERLRQTAGTLSGGQQQMLALAAAYVRDPRLIVVDEASLGLAPVTVDVVFSFLAKVAQAGTSILLVDQFVDRALALASHAYLLRKGEIGFSGTAAELAGTDIFAEYVGSPTDRTVEQREDTP